MFGSKRYVKYIYYKWIDLEFLLLLSLYMVVSVVFTGQNMRVNSKNDDAFRSKGCELIIKSPISEAYLFPTIY
jgi:hypothetical protein